MLWFLGLTVHRTHRADIFHIPVDSIDKADIPENRYAFLDEFNTIQWTISYGHSSNTFRLECVICWSIKKMETTMQQHWHCLYVPLFDSVHLLLKSMFRLILDLIRFHCSAFVLHWPHIAHCYCSCICTMEWIRLLHITGIWNQFQSFLINESNGSSLFIIRFAHIFVVKKENCAIVWSNCNWNFWILSHEELIQSLLFGLNHCTHVTRHSWRSNNHIWEPNIYSGLLLTCHSMLIFSCWKVDIHNSKLIWKAP